MANARIAIKCLVIALLVSCARSEPELEPDHTHMKGITVSRTTIGRVIKTTQLVNKENDYEQDDYEYTAEIGCC
jgi:hypothetical protein